MRIVARDTLTRFYENHPATKTSLERWHQVAKTEKWKTPLEVKARFSKAKVVSESRVRFEIQGGNFRMVVAFDFGRGIAFIKFIGTHAEYDKIDATKVNLF